MSQTLDKQVLNQNKELMSRREYYDSCPYLSRVLPLILKDSIEKQGIGMMMYSEDREKVISKLVYDIPRMPEMKDILLRNKKRIKYEKQEEFIQAVDKYISEQDREKLLVQAGVITPKKRTLTRRANVAAKQVSAKESYSAWEDENMPLFEKKWALIEDEKKKKFNEAIVSSHELKENHEYKKPYTLFMSEIMTEFYQLLDVKKVLIAKPKEIYVKFKKIFRKSGKLTEEKGVPVIQYNLKDAEKVWNYMFSQVNL